MHLKLSSNMLWLLLGVDVMLITLNVFPVGTRLIDDLLNLDKEANLAVWYSSTKLFVLAVLVWVAADHLSRLKWSMRLAAIAFLCISISEAALVHERLFGVAYTMLKGHEPTVGIPGGWIVYFAPAVIAVLTCIVICVYRLTQQFPGSRALHVCRFGVVGCSAMLLNLCHTFSPSIITRRFTRGNFLKNRAKCWGRPHFLGG